MHTTRTTMIDGFSGTARELLALLRTLHNGTNGHGGLTRLQSIDAVCERLATMRVRGGA